MSLGIRELEILIYEQSLHNAVMYENRCLRRAEEAEKELSAAKAAVYASEQSLKRARELYLARVPA